MTRRRLNFLGAAIWLIGLGCATWIWLAQDRIDRENANDQTDSSEPLSALDSRKPVRELEIQYGQAGVVLEQGLEFIESLAHGKRLAATVAVVSSALGIACFAAGTYLVPALERRRRRVD